MAAILAPDPIIRYSGAHSDFFSSADLRSVPSAIIANTKVTDAQKIGSRYAAPSRGSTGNPR
jgi:hypothetical protein